MVTPRGVVHDGELLTLDWATLAEAARAFTARRPPAAEPDARLAAAIGGMLARLRGASEGRPEGVLP